MKEATTKDAFKWVQEKINSIPELSNQSLTDNEKKELEALKTCERLLINTLSKENQANHEMNIDELSFQTYAFMNLTRDNLEDILEINSRFSVHKAKRLTKQLIKEYDHLLGIVFERSSIKINEEIVKLTSHVKNESKVVFK